MLPTACSYNGMIVTPHRLASQTGLAILRKGGNAVEAAIAAAATLCVVYPHMIGLGGDGFWLILPASQSGNKESLKAHSAASDPIFIDACGRSGGTGVNRAVDVGIVIADVLYHRYRAGRGQRGIALGLNRYGGAA